MALCSENSTWGLYPAAAQYVSYFLPEVATAVFVSLFLHLAIPTTSNRRLVSYKLNAFHTTLFQTVAPA